MKKKSIILSIAVITLVAILAGILTACSRATVQGQLANLLKDHSHEKFVYEVSNTLDDTKGTYTVEMQAYDADSNVTVDLDALDARTEKVKKGILVTGLLEIGNTVFKTGCYYNLIQNSSFMVPCFSYRQQLTDNVTSFAMFGSYSGSKYSYERIIDGTKSTGQIKLGGLYYDNNEFQQSLRSVTTFESGLSLQFTMPLVSAKEATSVTLFAAGSTIEKVHIPYADGIDDYKEDGISCYKITLSRSTEVASMSQQLYYAVENQTYNDWPVFKNVLVKFVEHQNDPTDGKPYDVEYKLKELSF